MQISCVTVDSADPAAAAGFWSDALHWHSVAVGVDGEIATCSAPGIPLYLEFVRVPEGKVVKNRVHLGCTAGSLDELEPELERLLGLGATIAWEEEFPPDIAECYRNIVLRDPEGNEFCLGAGTNPS